MVKTELQRVQSATEKQVVDFESRLKNIDKYALPTEVDPENAAVPCFCCDKEVIHTNGGGNGWWAEAHTGKGVFKTVMLHTECEDHPLIWRESNGGHSYTIVIGDRGPDGLTPETTRYIESNDD
ncbi:hypothetical protein ACPV3A_14615 [Paenibacillus sp. Dod16]|uniref:hypothetical protein n=1 Tax=Paenibacillus sp. Dod16 TaxID=3416392 RepID=UPI003CF94F52